MDDEQFHRIAKALAEQSRLDILREVTAAGELSCGAIVQRSPLSQPTVSHHLKVLTDANLLDVRREGPHGFFCARPDTLERYVSELRRRVGMPA